MTDECVETPMQDQATETPSRSLVTIGAIRNPCHSTFMQGAWHRQFKDLATAWLAWASAVSIGRALRLSCNAHGDAGRGGRGALRGCVASCCQARLRPPPAAPWREPRRNSASVDSTHRTGCSRGTARRCRTCRRGSAACPHAPRRATPRRSSGGNLPSMPDTAARPMDLGPAPSTRPRRTAGPRKKGGPRRRRSTSR